MSIDTNVAYVKDLCERIINSKSDNIVDPEKQIAHAINRREASPELLCQAAIQLLKEGSEFGNLIEDAWHGQIERLDQCFADGVIAELLAKPLFQVLLRASPILDIRVEQLLTYTRSRYLQNALKPNSEFDDDDLLVVSALSCNAHLSGYIFYESPKDTLNVEIIQSNLEADDSNELSSFLVALVGCFRPLSSIGLRDAIKAAPWFHEKGPVRDVLKLQIEDSERERELGLALPIVTEINDKISRAVQSQYEENPYPPWTNFVRNESMLPYEYFQAHCIGFDKQDFGDTNDISVLVAGCGTGRIAIHLATLLCHASVIGLDLSRSSLGYAARRAKELGVNNIDFVQGDILKINELNQEFDFIECGGVLHHLEHPVQGLKNLIEVCRPGGIIRMSLYSEKGRRALSFARPIVREFAKDVSSSEMRKARHKYIQMDKGSNLPASNAYRLYKFFDFYNLSMFRDLLFHVQEVEFNIPKIFDILNQLGMRFCGFYDPDGKIMKSYRHYMPHDPMGRDPQSWDKFETLDPDAFSSLYDFVIQKPLYH